MDLRGRAGPVRDVALLFGPGRVGCRVGDEGAELGEDVPELVDGGELFDVGLEECFGGGVVEGLDVGVDVAADALEGGDEAGRKEGQRFLASSTVGSEEEWKGPCRTMEAGSNGTEYLLLDTLQGSRSRHGIIFVWRGLLQLVLLALKASEEIPR